MTYIRHMDPSMDLNHRRRVAEDTVSLMEKFCRAASHKHAMQRLGDAFLYHLDSYAKSALLKESRYAKKYREELCHIITKARRITSQKRAREVSVHRG